MYYNSMDKTGAFYYKTNPTQNQRHQIKQIQAIYRVRISLTRKKYYKDTKFGIKNAIKLQLA